MKQSIKTCLIDGKTIAEFDAELMQLIKCESTTMRQVEKEDMRIGIRNEQGQIYRAIGITGAELYGETCCDIEELGFTDELEDKPPRKGYDNILAPDTVKHS